MKKPRKDHWEEWELQVIYDLVNEVEWFPKARKLIPYRSDNAIRTKMSHIRAEAGIVAGCIGPHAMSTYQAQKQQIRKATTRLRKALEMAA